MPEVATPNQAEREFETGSDEFFKGQSEAQSGLLFLNHKRVFDELLQESLETTRQQRSLFNKMVLDAQTLSNQIMQNAVAVAQKVSEQSARDGEPGRQAGRAPRRHRHRPAVERRRAGLHGRGDPGQPDLQGRHPRHCRGCRHRGSE